MKYIRKETCMQQDLFDNSLSEGHKGFFDDFSIIFINKSGIKKPNKQEQYWRHTFKTIALQSLNEKND